MNASTRPLLAIEIGGTKLQIVIGSRSGEILDRRRFAVDRAEGGAGIRRQISEALPDLLSKWNPSGAGVGYGGPVHWKTGQICCSHHIAGWDDFPLAEWLISESGIPSFVENDANTAALGEARHGAGIGFDPAFYVTLGSGVGGGLIANGAIYHGAPPGEVEIGHLRLAAGTEILEDRCSGWSVDRRIRGEVARPGAHGELARLVTGNPPGCEARHLVAALAAADPIAARILKDTTGPLALGLSHVVHLLHPAIIILGGGLSLMGERFRAAVESTLNPLIMDAFRPGPKVALAALGEDAVPIGALQLAADRLNAPILSAHAPGSDAPVDY